MHQYIMSVSSWKLCIFMLGVFHTVMIIGLVHADYTVLVKIESIHTISDQLLSTNCTAVQNGTCQDITVGVCLGDVTSAESNCSLWEINGTTVFESPLIQGQWPVSTGILTVSLYTTINQTEVLTDILSFIPNITSDRPILEIHTGERGVANLSLSITLTCADNYYGLYCGVYCVGRNDSTGHYSCNESTGSIVCLEGYTETELNCSQCISALNCSQIGGFCRLPGECLCLTGYTGVNCDNVLPSNTISANSPRTILIPSSKQTSQLPSITSFNTPQPSSTLRIQASSVSVVTMATPLPSPGGMGGKQNSGAIAGAVIGVLVVLIAVVTVITVIPIVLKMRRKQSVTNGPLWYIKVNPTVQRQKFPGSPVSAKGDFTKRSLRSLRSLTPDFLVVRHKKNKSTVPNGGQFLNVPTSAHMDYNIGMQSPVRPWSDSAPSIHSEGRTLSMITADPAPSMSGDDATLPRNICSPSAETDSTHPHGRMSAATSSIYQPGWSLKVYQIPSNEDDSVIMTNLGVDFEERIKEEKQKEKSDVLKPKSSKSL